MSALDAIEEKVKTPERLENVRKAIYQLRRRQFIWAGDWNASGAYDALVNYGCLDILEEHFELEGLALQHNTAEQWVGLMPLVEFVDLMPDERLLGDETLILLLLALAWREGVNNASIGHRGVVETTADTLMQRLSELTGRDRVRNPQIRDARVHDILKDFARRSLIQIGEEDPVYLDYAIEVRPMVAQLAGSDIIRRLEALALRGMPAAEETAKVETSDETEVPDSDAGAGVDTSTGDQTT